MFWISYSVIFILASAVAIALAAIRLVLSAAGRAFGWTALVNQESAATRQRVTYLRSRR
jgi:hypothetical protein